MGQSGSPSEDHASLPCQGRAPLFHLAPHGHRVTHAGADCPSGVQGASFLRFGNSRAGHMPGGPLSIGALRMHQNDRVWHVIHQNRHIGDF